jgi:hypothetical protein
MWAQIGKNEELWSRPRFWLRLRLLGSLDLIASLPATGGGKVPESSSIVL